MTLRLSLLSIEKNNKSIANRPLAYTLAERKATVGKLADKQCFKLVQQGESEWIIAVSATRWDMLRHSRVQKWKLCFITS